MNNLDITRSSTGYPASQAESKNVYDSPAKVSKIDKILRLIQWIFHYLTCGLIKEPKAMTEYHITKQSFPAPSAPPLDLQNYDEFMQAYGNSDYADYLYSQQLQLPNYEEFTKKNGDSVYIDMGKLYGTYVIGHFMKWWPEPVCIDQKKLDAFLEKFFTQLKADGTKSINLSFAQIQDIEKLLKSQAGASDDTITQIFEKNYPVGKTGNNFLKYFIQQANKNGIKGDISFGGAVATGPNMKIPMDPVQAAKDLVDFMKEYSFDSVDFDLEGSGAAQLMTQNSPKDVETFFKTLHGQLSSQNKSVILTVAGSIQDGPTGYLKPLFENFSNMSDGVNLMLYSNTQYYIDANNPTWGISQWIKYVPSSKINVGFYDSIDYTNPASSAGEKYNIPPGLTNGQAAAYIYIQLQKQLAKINPKNVPLGQPFFWTDNPSKLTTNTFMSDFIQYLQTHS